MNIELFLCKQIATRNAERFKFIPDKQFLKIKYYYIFEKKLNLTRPKTYNEKLQWLKLYDRNPFYTSLVDKYEVRNYIRDKIGEEYLIPLVGGPWTSFDEIDFNKLPEQFVLKCTHDSGGIVICKDKRTLNIPSAKNKIENCLKWNFYYSGREWPYKNIIPRIIAEQYMEDSEDKELRDYKFYTFNGIPKVLLLATDRQSSISELHFDYYDMSFNHLELKNHWHPNAPIQPHKPKQFELMKYLASKLSKEIPHVRVDFYEVNGHVFFGEMTFYDMSGFLILHPNDWERIWGDWIILPQK